MSAGLDTSVTLRLLTGVPTEQATAAREFVAASPSPVVISDLVIAETYFALRHHYEVPHADAVASKSSWTFRRASHPGTWILSARR